MKTPGLLALFAALTVSASAYASGNEPMHVIVSIKNQSLKLYEGGKEIASSNVSSGKRGYSTPTGIFSILQKSRHHRSNIYSGAPMPYMQRLTWSGIALHASNSVPRRPASHGCVRLPHKFAKKLFSMTQRGAHVIIEDQPVEPQTISHSFLFQPAAPYDASLLTDRWVREHVTNDKTRTEWQEDDKPLRILITRRTRKQDIVDAQRILNKLGFEAGDVDGIMGPATHKAIKAFEKANGYRVAGLVDRLTMVSLYTHAGEGVPPNGQLYVRQDFRPIFDAPIVISDAEKPLGSHLLSVKYFGKGTTSADWMAISLEDRINETLLSDGVRYSKNETGRKSVSDAMERIEMSDDVRKRISRLLTPKSSISISDNGISIETTPIGSDFIVLTKRGSQNS